MKQEEQPKPTKESRLTDRQCEVLGQLAEGKPATPEAGKRIDLTINSLIRRGLIEGETAAIEDAYQLTIAGLSLLENKSRSVEESFTLAEEDEAPPPRVGVKKPRYVPRVGDIVWFLDQDGETDQVDHLVREVFPEQKQVEISPRWGDDFKKETIRAHWSRVIPRDGK